MKWGMLAMKSRMSLFNLGVIKQDLKQHGWIGILYLIGLLFTIPLKLMMMASNVKDDPSRINQYQYIVDLFNINLEIQVVLLFSFPILAGIMIFRYLQTKESVDLYHSLPINRKSLYLNHITSGLFLLLPPILLTGITTWVVLQFAPLSKYLATSEVWNWVGILTLFTVLTFILSVVVGMITGLSIPQGILTYIFLFLPYGLIELVNYHLDLILYGYPAIYYGKVNSEQWSPIIRFTELQSSNYIAENGGAISTQVTNSNAFTGKETLIYLLLIILFLGIGYFLYRIRHSERATQVIAFIGLRPIFKYGVTFSFMLVSGSYFTQTQNHHFGWSIFGYIIGSFFGYLIAEMILKKTWRIFHRKLFLPFLAYTILMVFLFIGIKADVLGYQNELPETEEIESVFFGNAFYELKDNQTNGKNPFSTDPTFIESVRKAHQVIIEKRPEPVNLNVPNSRSIFIMYQLKDGRKIAREYTVLTEAVEDSLKPVMETEYYKSQLYNLDQLDRPIKMIQIHNGLVAKSPFAITDPNEIQELKQLIKEEILTMNYEQINDQRSPWGVFELIPTSSSENQKSYMPISFDWKKSYFRIEKWLLEKGYLDKARVMPEDIEYIEIAKIDLKETEEDAIKPEEVFLNAKGNIVQVKEKNFIGQALEQYNAYSTEGIYFIRFATVQGEKFYGVFTKDHTPAFVPDLFK